MDLHALNKLVVVRDFTEFLSFLFDAVLTHGRHNLGPHIIPGRRLIGFSTPTATVVIPVSQLQGAAAETYSGTRLSVEEAQDYYIYKLWATMQAAENLTWSLLEKAIYSEALRECSVFVNTASTKE